MLGSKKKAVMLVCLAFLFAEKKTRSHWSHWEARVSRHNHTAGSVTTGFGKRCVEATRWCLPKSQVHQRRIKTSWHFTTRSQPAAQFAREPPNLWKAFFLEYQAVRRLIWRPATILTRGQTSLPTLEGDAAEICHPEPQMSSSWCQKRRSHKSHRSPSSVGLWTSLQNKSCPDVKLF